MREATWSNLGVTSSTNDFGKLMQEADLNYKTVLGDAFTEYNGQKILIPGRKVTMREDTNQIFGIVSDRYQICQNQDALDFVQYIPNLELQKAGSYSWGGCYVIAKLPEIDLLGDVIRPNMIFENRHDGGGSIRATICMLRIVCQNQFTRAFKESPAMVSIRHLGNLEEKLALGQETMANVQNYLQNFQAEAEDLVGAKTSRALLNRVLEKFFEIKEDYSDRWKVIIEEQRDSFLKIYDTDDNQNFKGTRWGLVNAYSDYLTHQEPVRKGKNWEENRFYNSLNSSPMDEFVEFLKAA